MYYIRGGYAPKIHGRLIRETAMPPNESGAEYTTLPYVSTIRNKNMSNGINCISF